MRIGASSLALSILLSASPAFAQAMNDSLRITGDIPPTCAMEAIDDIALGALVVAAGSGMSSLQIAGSVRGESSDFRVTCNESNVMHLVPAEGRLVNVDRAVSATDDAGFTDRINYRVRVLGYQNDVSVPAPSYRSGEGLAGQDRPRGALHGRVRMAASVEAADNAGLRPIAGRYQDSVTVTVTVQ